MNHSLEQNLRTELAELIEDEAEARRELRRIVAQRVRAQNMLAGPRVIPVACYWRGLAHHEEPLEEGRCVADAFAYLDSLWQEALCTPDGVKVGGALIPMDEWERMP